METGLLPSSSFVPASIATESAVLLRSLCGAPLAVVLFCAVFVATALDAVPLLPVVLLVLPLGESAALL
ncbi:MAG: hypothetical protein Q4A16_09955 [Lautropia sp.]|nr:hypothetical protein [Lautropia sp.]